MSTAKTNQTYELLGVRIDALMINEAVARIVARAAKRNQPACYVVKPYVEFLDPTRTNARIRQLLNGSWLSLPDGVSTQWAAAYLYDGRPSWWRVMRLGASVIFRPRAVATRVPERFGGTRFTWKLLEAAAKEGLNVYLMGSPQGSDIKATARAIQKRLPKLTVSGTWPGELGGKQGRALEAALAEQPLEAELVADLEAKQPDLILVGMGFPLQELLMSKLTPQLHHGVLIGEGGTFDYDSFGGHRRKAPRVVQTVGLEWLWRLAIEPKRLGRQMAIPRFVWAVYRTSKQKP